MLVCVCVFFFQFMILPPISPGKHTEKRTQDRDEVEGRKGRGHAIDGSKSEHSRAGGDGSTAGGNGGGRGSGGGGGNNSIGDARDQKRAVSSMEQLWQVYVTVSKRELQFQSSSRSFGKVCVCVCVLN